MDLFSSAVVKRYERILRENPKSPAFCPLAEIYRMRKETDVAERLCLQGLKRHPRHYGGRIALARIYRDKDRLPEALQQLSRAKGIDPENPVAYELTGEICLQQKNSAAALQAYKMVLFLNPWNRFAAQIVRQSESSKSAGGAEDRSEKSRRKNSSGKKALSSAAPSDSFFNFPWDPFFFEKEQERRPGATMKTEGVTEPEKKGGRAAETGGASLAPLPEASLSDLSKRQRLRVLQKLLSHVESRINN